MPVGAADGVLMVDLPVPFRTGRGGTRDIQRRAAGIAPVVRPAHHSSRPAREGAPPSSKRSDAYSAGATVGAGQERFVFMIAETIRHGGRHCLSPPRSRPDRSSALSWPLTESLRTASVQWPRLEITPQWDGPGVPRLELHPARVEERFVLAGVFGIAGSFEEFCRCGGLGLGSWCHRQVRGSRDASASAR